MQEHRGRAVSASTEPDATPTLSPQQAQMASVLGRLLAAQWRRHCARDREQVGAAADKPAGADTTDPTGEVGPPN